jgi:hypothetical protein
MMGGWVVMDSKRLLGHHKYTIKSGGENVYSLEVSLQNIMP